MGWTHCFDGRRLPNGKIDRKYECDKMLTFDRKDKDGNVIGHTRVLKSAMVGSTYYAAVETVVGEKRNVVAAVFLTCGKTRWDNTEWGYKDMDETMGPYKYDCPKGILDLLTPTDWEEANKWRELCRKRLAEKKEAKKGNKEKFIPKGVSIVDEGRGSWTFTNENFYSQHWGYSGARYSKRRYHTYDHAMYSFLWRYGTAEQRAEWAATGRESLDDWKKGVA